MAGLRALTCGRCGATGQRTETPTMVIDPPGWSCVTVSSIPVRNIVLCPPCTDVVTAVLKAELVAVTGGRHAAGGA